jgi:hypothetical protein
MLDAAANRAERKRDTRDKIQLGGLIAKAGLRDCNKAVLLGALIELAAIQPESDEWLRLKKIGDGALKQDKR